MERSPPKLDQVPEPERTLVDCVLEGTLFGADHDSLARVLGIVEGRFLFGRADVNRLVPDHSGPEWIDASPKAIYEVRRVSCSALRAAVRPTPWLRRRYESFPGCGGR